MSVTFTVRDTARDLLQANLVVPSLPGGTPAYYVYPEDDNPAGAVGGIELLDFPTIIVQKGLYGDGDTWSRVTQADLEYTYWLEFVAFLGKADLPDWDKTRMAEDWQNALTAVILKYPTLNGTIDRILSNDNGQTIFSRDGFYDWYTQPTRNPDSYWGVGMRMQVVQVVSYAETVGVDP